MLERGGKLAVLAIDPSSERTKGSILGDKTYGTSLREGVLLLGQSLGWFTWEVARKTRESIILCEAAVDTIFVETVGAGSRRQQCAQWWTSSC